MPESNPPLRRYLRDLQRQLWLIALAGMLGVATAALVSHYQQPIYRASMKIVVGQGGGVFQPQFGATVEPFTQTMTNLLESDIVASTVIDQLHLKETPKGLLGRLVVHTRPQSSVLELRYDSPGKRQSVTILGQIGSVFAKLVDARLGSGSVSRTLTGQRLPPITASVFDPAHLEPGRVAPKPVRNMIIAGLLGVALGLILAFTRDALDDRIRSRHDAEQWFRAPVIGALPRGIRRGQLIGLGDRQALKKPALAQALHLLRANLQFSQAGIGGPMIVVTSALADNEGKSSVAANVAVALAQAGNRVICVEADLRRPRLARYLGVEPPKDGLVDLLEGRATLSRALLDVPLPPSGLDSQNGSLNLLTRRFGGADSKARALSQQAASIDRAIGKGGLRILSAGRVHSNPADLLTPQRVAKLLTEIRPQADYVIFDAPPLLMVGDAFPLIHDADNVIVVAREGWTNKGVAQAVRTTLEGLGVENISVVLTDSSPLDRFSHGYAEDEGRIDDMSFRSTSGSPRSS